MAKIIVVTNQKGGVGKTTTAVSLAAALVKSRKGRRVLLLDLDPQGNATTGLGVDKHQLELGAIHLLVDGVVAEEVIVPAGETGVDLIGTNKELTGAEILLAERENPLFILQEALAEPAARYDYIIIDCPPSLGLLTLNALTAATDIIVPVQCEYYALEGITALLETIYHVRDTTNPDLNIMGVLRTMYDRRNSLALQVSEELESHFGATVFKTIIPRNVRLAEAPSHGEPINRYAKRSRGARAYDKFTREVVQRS